MFFFARLSIILQIEEPLSINACILFTLNIDNRKKNSTINYSIFRKSLRSHILKIWKQSRGQIIFQYHYWEPMRFNHAWTNEIQSFLDKWDSTMLGPLRIYCVFVEAYSHWSYEQYDMTNVNMSTTTQLSTINSNISCQCHQNKKSPEDILILCMALQRQEPIGLIQFASLVIPININSDLLILQSNICNC